MQAARGFHLIELLIVVVVISTALAITIPRMSERDATYRMELATRRVQEDIETARRTARFESRPVSITFDPVVSSYFTWAGQPPENDALIVTRPSGLPALSTVDLADTDVKRIVSVSPTTRVAYSLAGDVLARQVYLGGSPFKSKLLKADFGGLTTLTFDGFGVAVASGTVSVGVKSIGRELAVSSDSGTVTVRTLSKTEADTLEATHKTAVDAESGREWQDLLKIDDTLLQSENDVKFVGGGG